MLELKDIFHLPALAALVNRLVSEPDPGLVVVAGFDPRPLAPNVPGGFLPSGRAALFGMLVDAALASRPESKTVLVARDREVVRIPRQFKRQVSYSPVEGPYTYRGRIAELVNRGAGLLVVDQLNEASIEAILEAAHNGLRVITQLDTALVGAQISRRLTELGASLENLANLSWAISIQRLATLCSNCKQPALPTPGQLSQLQAHYADLATLFGQPGDAPTSGEIGTFFRAPGCPHCHYTGRSGDVAVFDVFHAGEQAEDLFSQPSLLPIKTYIMYLACLGRLPLEDYLYFEADQFTRTFQMLVAGEQALVDTRAAYARKLAELEAANRVLEQRTRSLLSLQEITQTLITTTGLADLAERVCRRVGDLCGADRAVLYLLRAEDRVEALAAGGWDLARVEKNLSLSHFMPVSAGEEPVDYPYWPPGIARRHPDVEGAQLRAGLYVPLVAQEEQVGVMVVHSTRKRRFTQGEVALLRAFANQAALAIQRADLVEQLQAKVAALEAAQAGLARKERLERELELARQVQRRVLPRAFPLAPGLRFAARYSPARQVGGDFYDVIALDERRFGFAIADVSDKGMPAALFMALTRSLLLAEARREASPSAVLASINRLLLELSEPSMFVTAFYGVVDQETGLLSYARAGHDYPLHIRKGSVNSLSGRGMPLGIFPGDEFHIEEVNTRLQPGDRLVLYTDGLSDVMNESGELYESLRLKELFCSKAQLPPEQMCAAVFDELLAFQGQAEQFDDMAMLVIDLVAPISS
jgi:sigma-B regulation protein RsbU (phosphoserine phosphatase)